MSRLEELEIEIRKAFATGRHERTGELLKEAKQLLMHGTWVNWAESVSGVSIQAINKHVRGEIGIGSRPVALLSQPRAIISSIPTFKL